jgi:hypothetical protein
MDARRKPLITVNPLFAKTSELPPVPSMEALTDEHMALNLPSIAKNTLLELENDLNQVAEVSTVDEDESDDETVFDENEETFEDNEVESMSTDLVQDKSKEGSLEEFEVVNEDNSSEELTQEDSEDLNDNDSDDNNSDDDDINDDSEDDDDDLVDDDDSNDNGDDDSDDDDSDDDGGDDDDSDNDGDDDGGSTPPAGNDSVKEDLKSKFSGLMGNAKGLGSLKGKFGI